MDWLFSIDSSWPLWRILLVLIPDLIIRLAVLGWVPYRRKPSSALGWLLAIYLIPYIGVAVYLMLGRAKFPKRRRRRQQTVSDLIRETTDNQAIIGTEEGLRRAHLTAARLNSSLGALPLVYGNELDLMPETGEAIKQMAQAVDEAEDYVHFEFYIVAYDQTSAPLFDALLRAHERGVTVRVLIDHIGSLGFPGYSKLVKMLDESGIDWHRSLPIRPWRGEYQRPDLRNHRKLLVVDGTLGFTGSLNIIDPSYNKRSNLRRGYQWKDQFIACRGPVVRELDAVFGTDWYAETGVILSEELTLELHAPESGGLAAQVVPSGPGFELENNLKLFNHLIYNAAEQLVICSPYFVPDESLKQALVSIGHSGVDVRIYVSEQSNHYIAQKAQESYYDELIEAGVRIFRYPAPTVLHSKFIIVDDDITVIGSSNMDERSFTMNMELSVLIVSEDFASRMYELEQAEYASTSEELELEVWRQRPLGVKYMENVCRLTSSLL